MAKDWFDSFNKKKEKETRDAFQYWMLECREHPEYSEADRDRAWNKALLRARGREIPMQSANAAPTTQANGPVTG